MKRASACIANRKTFSKNCAKACRAPRPRRVAPWRRLRSRTGFRLGGSFSRRSAAARVLWYCRPGLAESPDFPGRTPVLIEPKSAFGTGHHATTALCLGVVSDLLDQGRIASGQTFLDLGTGSGVLGIACCKSGLSGLGLDIDPLAVDNALENRELNQVRGFDAALGGIEAAVGHSFDLVLANILARPLMELAPAVAAARKPHGCLVLSGLLEIQADGVEAAYKAQGLPTAGGSLRENGAPWSGSNPGPLAAVNFNLSGIIIDKLKGLRQAGLI